LAEQVADERLRAAVDNAFAGMADHMINRP
jgi:hypothetical protein